MKPGEHTPGPWIVIPCTKAEPHDCQAFGVQRGDGLDEVTA